jgi:glutamine amidotransferase
MDGKEYVFAHNGNVESIKNLQVRRFRPLGDTDSEHSFCHLLAQMETQGLGARNSGEWTREDFSKLSSILQGINAHGKFNCLLSDGRFLFSYYDYRSRGSLYFTHRKPPYGPVQLLDKDWTVDLAEEKDPAQSGFIVATEKLTNEEWEKFSAGELIVFHGGKMVFSSSRDISLFSSLSALQLRILKILRESPNRMRLGEIQSQVSSPAEILQENIRLLLEEGFIQQDGRDSVNWDHPTATYYTLRGETGGDRLPPA